MVLRLAPLLGKLLATAGAASGSVVTYTMVIPKSETNLQDTQEETVTHNITDIKNWVLKSQCDSTDWTLPRGGTSYILSCTDKNKDDTGKEIKYRFFLDRKLERYGTFAHYSRRSSNQSGWEAEFSKNEEGDLFLKIYDGNKSVRVAKDLEIVNLPVVQGGGSTHLQN